MKKLFKHLTFALLLGSLGFGLAQRSKDVVRADAASPTTKRVWAKIVNKDQWDADGASTYIYYWGPNGAYHSWFGVPVKWDSTNDLVYYDVHPDTTHVIFVRVNKNKDGVWNQTADLEATGHFDTWYFNLTGYGGGEWKNDLTIKTTKIVSDFAATIDTKEEACSSLATQAAVNAYNELSTFEQNQFNDLDVGEGVTGLQRLNYLISFYGIDTPIGSSVPGRIPSSDNSATATLIISALGVSSLAGYYFISKKKLFG